MSIKEEVVQAIQRLPEDCTYEEILADLYFRKQVDEGLRDVLEGRVVTHEELKERVARWRQSASR